MRKLSYNDKLLVDHTKLSNNVRSTLIVKIGQLSITYKYLTLRHAMRKK